MSKSRIRFHRLFTFMIILIMLIVMVDTLPHTIMYGIAGWQIGVWGNKLYNWIMSRTVDPYEETEEG
jgi:hypothetical protein